MRPGVGSRIPDRSGNFSLAVLTGARRPPPERRSGNSRLSVRSRLSPHSARHRLPPSQGEKDGSGGRPELQSRKKHVSSESAVSSEAYSRITLDCTFAIFEDSRGRTQSGKPAHPSAAPPNGNIARCGRAVQRP